MPAVGLIAVLGVVLLGAFILSKPSAPPAQAPAAPNQGGNALNGLLGAVNSLAGGRQATAGPVAPTGPLNLSALNNRPTNATSYAALGGSIAGTLPGLVTATGGAINGASKNAPGPGASIQGPGSQPDNGSVNGQADPTTQAALLASQGRSYEASQLLLGQGAQGPGASANPSNANGIATNQTGIGARSGGTLKSDPTQVQTQNQFAASSGVTSADIVPTSVPNYTPADYAPDLTTDGSA